jgi:CRP-like cAMP-binding protein
MNMIKIIMLPKPFDLLPPSAVTPVHLFTGENAFRQGDTSRGPYLLVAGSVAMVRHSEAGQRIVLYQAAASDTLAEASLFSDNYHCDCVASQESELIRFDKAAILSRIARDAGFASALMQRLASQVQDYRRRIEILAIKTAEDRVLAALAEFGQKGSVMEFAARIGLSHEATYRALSSLVRRGVAERVARGRYRVRD